MRELRGLGFPSLACENSAQDAEQFRIQATGRDFYKKDLNLWVYTWGIIENKHHKTKVSIKHKGPFSISITFEVRSK